MRFCVWALALCVLPSSASSDTRAVVAVEHYVNVLERLDARWVATSPDSAGLDGLAAELRRSSAELGATALFAEGSGPPAGARPRGLATAAEILCAAASALENAIRSQEPAGKAFAMCRNQLAILADNVDRATECLLWEMRQGESHIIVYPRPDSTMGRLSVPDMVRVRRITGAEAHVLYQSVGRRFPARPVGSSHQTPFADAARRLLSRLEFGAR